jgi:malate dehydrogenase (oxaloacetate-decarboxylating)
MDFYQESLKSRQNGSPLFTGSKVDLKNKDDLSIYYSPGIAEPCREISRENSLAKKLTIKRNTIAVISDGSAVLGLGNIGAEAGLPVMEGKCLLFKKFGNVDAIPIVLKTQNTEEIIETITNIAPTFGGINLEDIAAPRCFEIEERLSEKLDIPVFHDDQDGTAMVCTAGILNACKVDGKKIEQVKIVISGAGAAGISVAKMLQSFGAKNILMLDSKGILTKNRKDLNESKQKFAVNFPGKILADAIIGADIFIGVSKGNILSSEMVSAMNKRAIIFALANPEPEIMPNLALEAGAEIVATGRSDFPNQINNVLIFPGFFRGILDAGISKINYDMKLAAAKALSEVVKNPSAEKIIPDPFDDGVVKAVSLAVKNFNK